ncbi:hypothetical protein ACHAWF_016213 [Thalassiosira exigua]
MPRGYLKHNREVSKRKARGGSSGQGYVAEKDVDHPRIRNVEDDFFVRASNARCNAQGKGSSSRPARECGECAICLKEVPLLCLSNKCKWHDAACEQCLHRIYVTNPQKSSNIKSYPLTCFHPLCDQPVHAAMLEKHSIFHSSDEVKRHHALLVLSKIKKNGLKTVYCPKCDAPRGVGNLGDKDKTFHCSSRDCNASYQVSPYYATIRALENMKSDSFGINDGWAKCPHCGILISKGDGCEHMICTFCDHEFYWDEVQVGRICHARVPDEEIFRWW